MLAERPDEYQAEPSCALAGLTPSKSDRDRIRAIAKLRCNLAHPLLGVDVDALLDGTVVQHVRDGCQRNPRCSSHVGDRRAWCHSFYRAAQMTELVGTVTWRMAGSAWQLARRLIDRHLSPCS